MRIIIPSIFLFLGIIVTYLLSHKLTNNIQLSLISAVVYSLSAIVIYHNNFGQYIGDEFSPIFVGFASLILIELLENKRTIKNILFFIVLTLSAIYFWNGGFYVLAIIFATLIMSYLLRIGKDTLNIIVSALLCIPIGFLILSSFPTVFLQSPPFITIDFWETLYYFNLSLLLIPIGFCYILSKNSNKNDIALISIFAILLVTSILYIKNFRWIALIGIPVSIFSGIAIYSVSKYLSKTNFSSYLKLVIILLILQFYLNGIANQNNFPSLEGTTISTFSTMSWIANNTNSNSTFLAYWSDASMLEALTNRTVFLDDFSTDAKLNNLTEFYIGNNLNYLGRIKPDYLWVRYFTKNEYALNQSKYENTTLFKLLYLCNVCKVGNTTLSKIYQNQDGLIFKVA